MVEFSPERRINKHPQRRPSIFDGLPFRITTEGYRAYSAEDYLRALSEREEEELKRTHSSIKAAQAVGADKAAEVSKADQIRRRIREFESSNPSINKENLGRLHGYIAELYEATFKRTSYQPEHQVEINLGNPDVTDPTVPK